MSLGRIPRSKAMKYAVDAGLDSAMMEAFWILIQRMDAHYLEWIQNEQEKKSKSTGKGVGTKRVQK